MLDEDDPSSNQRTVSINPYKAFRSATQSMNHSIYGTTKIGSLYPSSLIGAEEKCWPSPFPDTIEAQQTHWSHRVLLIVTWNELTQGPRTVCSRSVLKCMSLKQIVTWIAFTCKCIRRSKLLICGYCCCHRCPFHHLSFFEMYLEVYYFLVCEWPRTVFRFFAWVQTTFIALSVLALVSNGKFCLRMSLCNYRYHAGLARLRKLSTLYVYGCKEHRFIKLADFSKHPRILKGIPLVWWLI